AFEVVDGGERQIMDKRNRLRSHETRKQAADEPWPCGRGDAIQIAKPKVGFCESRLDQPVEHLHVSASRDLGHDAAIGLMILELRPHNIRKGNAIACEIAPYNCSGSFIAACLNTEYG